SILKQDGTDVQLSSNAETVIKTGEGVRLTVRAGNERRTLEGSHLLTATGRTPNTENLRVSAAGISTDERGFIKVNGKLETNVEGVYALGDIKGGPAFTHIS